MSGHHPDKGAHSFFVAIIDEKRGLKVKFRGINHCAKCAIFC
jgi:hypothetical protein